MVDTQYFTKTELEELFGTLEQTPDQRIFKRHNINLEHLRGPVFYVAAVHFDNKQKRSYYAVDVPAALMPEREVDETDESYDQKVKAAETEADQTAFKKMQDACQLLEDTGNWPVPF